MKAPVNEVGPTGFERLARPLLELIQHLTGLETTFVTQIDWAAQRQEVLLALNTAELQVVEGSVTSWSETMCRQAFLSNKDHSCDVPTDFPGSLAAEQLGMRSYFALPILDGDDTIGTVCGASRRSVALSPDVLGNVRLVCEALSLQMSSYVETQALRQRAESAEALALVDPLTGLANRRAFTSRFEEELSRSGRCDTSIAVLAIDLDGFKTVNDSFGHPGGDKVLVTAGDVLRRAARAEDVPARIGGDEFALLLPQCLAVDAERVASRVAAEFRCAAAELNMPCTLSIGIGTSERGPRTSLLARADEALYRSKANTGDRAEAWAF